MRGTRRQGLHAARTRTGASHPAADGPSRARPAAPGPATSGPATSEQVVAVGTRPAGVAVTVDPGAGPAHAATPNRRGRALLRGVVRRDRTLMVGGAQLRVLVLACAPDDVTAVDLASGSLVRLRVSWPAGSAPGLSPFDVVEARLADDPQCDDLAQPEAATAAAPVRRVGTLQGRRARSMLARIATGHDDPLLGFHGPSAPYWDFDGLRPSVALIRPTRGPQLFQRAADGTTWVRFGWERDDVWLPVEDERAVRALGASAGERLAGRALAGALGFTPHYLLVALSAPREGHCYKVCAAVLPKG